MPDTGPVTAIIQARMSSTRLPGKVMLPLCDRPILQYQIERLRHSERLDQIAVATCETPDCDPIAGLCTDLGVHVTRGDEDDVLSRYAKCAREVDAGVVVRITSDCPLIDPYIVDKAIAHYQEAAVDFCGLDIPNTFPRGIDIEIFAATHLYEADREATTRIDREHVAPFIYTQPERFTCRRIEGPHGQGYRLCVDTEEDFDLVKKIAEHFDCTDTFRCEDIVALLDARPEWAEINAEIVQKDLL